MGDLTRMALVNGDEHLLDLRDQANGSWPWPLRGEWRVYPDGSVRHEATVLEAAS